jgi:hypothetical protein
MLDAMLCETDHDLLQPGEFPTPAIPPSFAVAGAVEATNRNLRTQRHMVIDPHVTEFERIDDAQCTADVTGPNRCRQAIPDVVGECDRVGLSSNS